MVRACLLDLNVLIALAWPNHSHHQRVTDWFGQLNGQNWATCPLTESGFVRLSSNDRITSRTVSPDQAIELLRQIRLLPGHQFWPDTIALSHHPSELLRGHRQVTDYHLLCLARSRGARLVTLDQGIAQLVPKEQQINDTLIVL